MIELYGNPASRANRVRWTLLECGTAFVEHHVELGPTGTRSAEFLEINPNGHIPVLVDDGQTIVESVAICFYLARRYGRELFPTDWKLAALAYQWPVWALTELERHLEVAGAHHSWLPPEQRRAELAAKALATLAGPLGIMEATLGQHAHLASDDFCVADIVVAEMMTASEAAGLDLATYPEISRWLTGCLERPAAREALAGPDPAPS